MAVVAFLSLHNTKAVLAIVLPPQEKAWPKLFPRQASGKVSSKNCSTIGKQWIAYLHREWKDIAHKASNGWEKRTNGFFV
jgi:hypothetical protein